VAKFSVLSDRDWIGPNVKMMEDRNNVTVHVRMGGPVAMRGPMAGVPAFLSKLWSITDEPETNNVISWGLKGDSLVIHDPDVFTKKLLPLHYKHNNMASFVRQLNMYGFRKVQYHEKLTETEDIEFAHPHFVKKGRNMLKLIKRRTGTCEAKLEKAAHSSKTIGTLKRENEALWRDLADLRQKHNKQAVTINKILKYLTANPGHCCDCKRKGADLLLNGLNGQTHSQVNDRSNNNKKRRVYSDIGNSNTSSEILEFPEELQGGGGGRTYSVEGIPRVKSEHDRDRNSEFILGFNSDLEISIEEVDGDNDIT